MTTKERINQLAFLSLGASTLVCYGFIVLTYKTFSGTIEADPRLKGVATSHLLTINFTVNMLGMFFFNAVKNPRWKDPRIIPASCGTIIVASIMPLVFGLKGDMALPFYALCVLSGVYALVSSVLQAVVYSFVGRYSTGCVRMIAYGGSIIGVVKYLAASIYTIATFDKTNGTWKKWEGQWYLEFGSVILTVVLSMVFYFLMEKRASKPVESKVEIPEEPRVYLVELRSNGSSSSELSCESGRLTDEFREKALRRALEAHDLQEQTELASFAFGCTELTPGEAEETPSETENDSSEAKPDKAEESKGGVALKSPRVSPKYEIALMFLLYVVTSFHQVSAEVTSGGLMGPPVLLAISIANPIGKALTNFRVPNWTLYTLTATRVVCPLLPLILWRASEPNDEVLEEAWYRALILVFAVFSGLTSGFVGTSLTLSSKNRVKLLASLFAGTVVGTLLYTIQFYTFGGAPVLPLGPWNSTENATSTEWPIALTT